MSTETALARIDRLADQFEGVLRDFVADVSTSSVANLHDAMAYALAVDTDEARLRGKRIRPALCLLTAEALGAELERAYPFALAIELMHNFCLVHDDIEDGDTMRRGRPSVWTRFGLAHGVNVGDFLLIQTHRALSDWGTPELDAATRLRLLTLLGRTLERTHIGQALDINARNDRTITVEHYFEIVREKTGFYLAAPIQGGAIVAGADDETIMRIEEMAASLGPMFQIADDIIDLTDGKGRGEAGSDIREGKRSFLVVHAAATCAAADGEKLFSILDKPRKETTIEDVAWVTEFFEGSGAIKAGRSRCRDLYSESVTVLDRLPSSLSSALGPVFEAISQREH